MKAIPGSCGFMMDTRFLPYDLYLWIFDWLLIKRIIRVSVFFIKADMADTKKTLILYLRVKLQDLVKISGTVKLF